MSTGRHKREEYWARINRAVDFIQDNLHEELTLPQIASAAYFSKFHFHRLFRYFMGETVNQFVQRVRLEKAAGLLAANPKTPITRIAMDCGYSSSASFSRAFRSAHGMSPSQWRKRCEEPVDAIINEPLGKIGISNSKMGTSEGKDGKETGGPIPYPGSTTEFQTQDDLRSREMEMKQALEIRVEEMPETPVAYVRDVGPYKGDSELFKGLFDRLFRWAGPRNLLDFPKTQIICVYHDSPEITDEDKLRTSACITVPEDTEVSGEVGKMTLMGGKYVRCRFEVGPDEYEAAWNSVCGGWLPDSGYQPADGPPFELCLSDPDDHPEGMAMIEICVPVKPL